MSTVPSMADVDIASKRVLIRADLNVPIADGVVTSDARIRASLPTIERALAANAAVVVMSHLGRPTEGEFDAASSLAPVALRLGELLNRPVALLPAAGPLRRRGQWRGGPAGKRAFPVG